MIAPETDRLSTIDATFQVAAALVASAGLLLSALLLLTGP